MNDATAKLTLAAGLAAGGLFAFSATVDAQGIGVDEFERMLVPTDRKIDRGEQVYQNQCAGCHGPDGQGNVEYPAERFQNETPDFTAGHYRHGGGLIQIYNVVSKGLSAGAAGSDTASGEAENGDPSDGDDSTGGTSASGPSHPTYSKALRYQERWAVAHFVRSLADDETALPEDPPEVRDQARLEAKRGTCDTEVKTSISSRVEPKGDEQLEKGKELYASQCASCHGDNGKGDGPAGQALNPGPRNFHDADAEWTNGTSPLNMFNTLTNGIEGSAMASYASMPEEDRWALTHYVRQWVPEDKRQESTDEDIAAVCRSLSSPEPPEPVSVERAIEALLADQPENRKIERARYGPTRLAPEANAERGKEIYQTECAQCHGGGFQGKTLGPLAIDRAPKPHLENPTLSFQVSRLKAGHTGGTFRQFATRASAGVHATLPGMDSASLLTEQDWKDLQAFIASSVEGDADRDTLRRDQTAPGDTSPSGADSDDSNTASDNSSHSTGATEEQSASDSSSDDGAASDNSDDSTDASDTDQ